MTVVPICINTVQFPLPKASRVYAMGKAMRAALTTGSGAGVRKVHINYHIPISNTATGLLALEKRLKFRRIGRPYCLSKLNWQTLCCNRRPLPCEPSKRASTW